MVADLQPGGRFVASDLYDAGGVGAGHARAPQATGPAARRLARRSMVGRSPRSRPPPPRRPASRWSCPIDRPLKATGGLAILHGSLAPDGCVVKLAGHERRLHRGPARVFESEADCYAAVRDRRIVPGDVVVIRNEGPVGGPGMQEMLSVTAALVGEGLGDYGRAPHRRPVLGRDPRPDDRPRRARRRRSAARSRSCAKATRSSSTSIARRSTWRSPPTRSRARLAAWTPPAPRYTGGVMAKYAALVDSASRGAVTTGSRMSASLRGR